MMNLYAIGTELSLLTKEDDGKKKEVPCIISGIKILGNDHVQYLVIYWTSGTRIKEWVNSYELDPLKYKSFNFEIGFKYSNKD